MHRDNAQQTGVALEKAYRFVLWVVPTVEKFPRSQRFLLGDRKVFVVFRIASAVG